MKINIQNQNRYGSMAAWTVSRPSDKDALPLEVMKIDLPVNEFHTFNLEIESTIFEREIFASLRNHIMWARGSRIYDVLEFECDEHVRHLAHFEVVRECMRSESKRSRQDDYRLSLPILSKTNYSIQTNFRQLVKIIKYMDYLSDISADKYISAILKESAHSIFDSLHESMFISKETLFEVIQGYGNSKILNERKINQRSHRPDGDIITICMKIPFALRAQIVRHRNLTILDDMFSQVSTNRNFHKTLLNDGLLCKMSCTTEFAEELIKRRNCWVAHYALWHPVINELNQHLNIKLPCDSGKCPYSGDAMLRYVGKDPNPPCPIHMDLNDLKSSEEQFDEMRTMVVEDNREPDFWNEKINKVELKV